MTERTMNSTLGVSELSTQMAPYFNLSEPYPELDVKSVTESLQPDNPIFYYRVEIGHGYLEPRAEFSFIWESGIEPLMERFDEAWRQLADL